MACSSGDQSAVRCVKDICRRATTCGESEPSLIMMSCIGKRPHSPHLSNGWPKQAICQEAHDGIRHGHLSDSIRLLAGNAYYQVVSKSSV
jgi:hypothetical protein